VHLINGHIYRDGVCIQNKRDSMFRLAFGCICHTEMEVKPRRWYKIDKEMLLILNLGIHLLQSVQASRVTSTVPT